jgi:hypothetical protein
MARQPTEMPGHYCAWLAEREGFEPSDEFSLVNSLAVSPIRPLSHLSFTSILADRAP